TDRLTQQVVEKIVGASRDVFRAAVYAGQEQMPDLPAMTDKNLKILIEEAAGVTLLEEAKKEFEAAQKRAQAAASERDAFDATMTDPSAISAQRAALQAKIDALNELKRKRSIEAEKAKNLGDEVK